VKKVKAQSGLDESVDEIMFSILSEMDNMDDFDFDNVSDDDVAGVQDTSMPDLDSQAELPVDENWVIMCHGEEDGKKMTEVWGTYPSKEAAVEDLKKCIKDEFGDEELAKVEGQLGQEPVEVNGWIKDVVQMKSPESADVEAPSEEPASDMPKDLSNEMPEESEVPEASDDENSEKEF